MRFVLHLVSLWKRLLCRACELTLLRPLWQLFMTMENDLNKDPTSVTVLLPLHRALTELFFIAEAHASVSNACSVAVVTSHGSPLRETQSSCWSQAMFAELS